MPSLCWSPGGAAAQSISTRWCHPNHPLTIITHDYRGIGFLDNWTGNCVQSVGSYLDLVTCLAKDIFLTLESHNFSLSLWSLDNKM